MGIGCSQERGDRILPYKGENRNGAIQVELEKGGKETKYNSGKSNWR